MVCAYTKENVCHETITTATLNYLGHSEEGSGNWCFKDGTISFQEIFNLITKYCKNKLVTIISDCSHSGQWVRECAKTLDSLHIPPCGHRARENRALVKVFASWNIQRIKRRERGRDMWYYIMLHRPGEDYREAFKAQYKKDPALRLSDWGYILESGEGEDPPKEITENWTAISS